MHKRLALTAASAVVFLLLAGCASEPGMEIVVTTNAASAESSEIVTPTPTVTAGVVTLAPSPTPTEDAAATPEEAWVRAAQKYLNGWGWWDFTNDQLLSAGLYACESTEDTPIIIEGLGDAENNPLHNAELVKLARTILCP